MPGSSAAEVAPRGMEDPMVSSVTVETSCALPAPASAPVLAAATEAEELVDMETAAVARIAAQHRVPFLGVRAVSDGAGDPLGERGFPLQFFDYYRLAARNAATVTAAVVQTLGTLPTDAAGKRVCRLLAQRRWERAATRIRDRP
jgi:Phosphorylase superfamily